MRSSRDSIGDVWGPRTPYRAANEWPARVDERVIVEPERWVQSACVLCSNGCALDIAVKDNRIVGVRGRAEDRVNRGRLGPKGLHAWVANASRDRLLYPLIRRNGELQQAGWDEALGLVVRRSRELKREFTAGSIGFYTSGQLMLEEYYTQAVIARAGIGTNHMDGNTRLCTATAAMALIESFGSDGDPGSYTDFDVTDAIFLVGHNMAETQTVLWSRILDRIAGPRPPQLIVVDPRRTPTARQADVHLAPRPGSNLALLNGLLHLVLKNGKLDHRFIDDHTVGFSGLEETVARYDPATVERWTGVPPRLLEAAADILGGSPSLVSTCLQGVYQSMQATASAVQVNNLHLVRGLIGKPGSTVFQMNGQPTAQNTRECGANGELAAFLNYANPKHIEYLAAHWNVRPSDLPHYAPPTHIMNMLQLAEEGSLRMLWVTGTNPAVSLPQLDRVRKVLSSDSLFLVVQDAFLTETAQLADVVLPVALWGEKTGTFTNADRTVHIAHKAVDPPGKCRSDLDIFLEYARRMEFTDKDDMPLIKWSDPEGAFDHFKELSSGRPCDYSGLSYAKLSQGSGIQWPCNDANPRGQERLYQDGTFHTAADDCETYGHDLLTGAMITPEEYRAKDPAGRANIKAADYHPPLEQPDEDYPLWLSTGRNVYHFHTRTKTGRTAELVQAAPDVYAELSPDDAARLSIQEGDRVAIESRRGRIFARARLSEIPAGLVFVPFHFGSWDAPDRSRAANELTMTGWDPVSKQPLFKYAAVRIRKEQG